MKYLLPCLLLAFCLGSCSKHVYTVQSVGFVSEQNGAITIRSTGFGKTADEAMNSAEQYAIELLLFRGLPGSQQTTPLVGIDEATAKSRYKQYFEELLANGRHKTFVLSSIPVSDFAKHDWSQRNVTMDVRINLTALRSDLETHGIIRKFGY
ncbi:MULTISPECIES: hypothetical protein [unclassified Alistipes]|uniref:hypothetical protein n=1 Tax=unclassified Alistipes TaxID=2608932 RepID=UPI00258BBE40|nr:MULTISPECIES: hypothetical protein [unclassified Alistipes]HUN14476.1 hypothetical protein [Alistipes sp.]